MRLLAGSREADFGEKEAIKETALPHEFGGLGGDSLLKISEVRKSRETVKTDHRPTVCTQACTYVGWSIFLFHEIRNKCKISSTFRT
jgi:hypothetical protein